MIEIIEQPAITKVRTFKCKSQKCGCKFKSDEWYEEYKIIKQSCPVCGSRDVVEL